MDTIGNNIANVNTYGFKSSRVTFSDVYYQSTSTGSAPTTQLGGTNPTQIGYGASVATIDVLNSVSGMSNTDRALDIYINGEGMIATKDASGNLRYSRLGALGFDALGNLVDSNGNFVMGFPMDAATGLPIIRPDGTCDIEDLTQITVDPAMLDQMTGISISSTGEIIGVLPGDTDVKLVSGLPAWLRNITVPEGSNLSGNVNASMEFRSVSDSPMPADWITAVEAKVNSGVEGDYRFSYDGTTISAMNTATGKVYTGAYARGGKVELKDAAGNVGFTVTTDNLTIPIAGAMGTMSFTKEQWITVSATDKGGNKLYYESLYDGVQPSMTFGEGTTAVTLQLDPGAVETVAESQLTYDNTGVSGSDFSSWLRGATLSTSSGIAEGTIRLEAGMEPQVTLRIGGTYTALNWMDATAINKLLTDYANAYAAATNDTSSISFSIDAVTNSAGNQCDITIKDGSGYIVATAQYDPTDTTLTAVTLTAGGGWVGTGATDDWTASTWADDMGITLPANILSTGSLPTAMNGTNISLGSAKFQKMIRAYDADNKLIGQAAYSSGSAVSLGDLTLSVDAAALKTFFAAELYADHSKIDTTTDNSVTIGSNARVDVEQWEFSKKIANAAPDSSESIVLGVIALGKVNNPSAMLQDGSSYFLTSQNSGEAMFTRPGLNGTGGLKAGYLEMSNVDISKEFTDMITTQRGFQANSRIITVSDSMLEELVNLKR